MKPVQIDDVLKFKYLSEIAWSPEGGSTAMVVTEADRKNNGYKSYIYVSKGGRFERLTSGGKERSFRYFDEKTLLFPGNREEEDADGAGAKGPDLTSRWYKIRLDGGEARLAYTFPIPVSQVIPLAGGDLIVKGTTMPGFEDLYKGDKKLLAEYKKYAKENADYEEIAQVPWWWNGGTFTKGAYDSLFYYDHKKKTLVRLTGLNESVGQVRVREISGDEAEVSGSRAEVSGHRTEVYYINFPVKPLLPMTGVAELRRLNLETREEKTIIGCREDFEIQGFELGESFLLLLAADEHNGLNTDTDFYKIDYETGKAELYAKHGEAIGTSVGSDVRYGGGRALKMLGDTCYFISTRFDGAYLFMLKDGVITQISERPGSVDCFDVCEAGGAGKTAGGSGVKALAIALYDMRGQEVYDEKSRRLTHFNDGVLRGKYVAQPETLNVQRDGYEVHGFVLKPFGYEPGRKYPVIIDIHGGPKTVYGEVFYHEMQYWAGKGYFVIFCNPTGSDGRGDFMNILGKYGTVDYEDIMAFCDKALEEWPDMDADNFFETGGSYGGFMTNWIIGHTDRFRACASQRSISNWFSMYGVSDIGVSFTRDQCKSDPWNDPEKLWFHSPMKYADKAVTPTLFIHSFEDYRCPIDQGYQMFTSLIAHGVESKMVTFKGENHELSRSGKPEHRMKRLREITEWFEVHKG